MEKTQLFLITDEGINKLAKKITQQLMPLRKAIDITEEETFLTIDELSKLIKICSATKSRRIPSKKPIYLSFT